MVILNYFKCCLKRSVRFIPYAMIFAAVIAVLLAVLFVSLFDTEENVVELNHKVSIGIVGNNEDAYIKMGIDAVQTVDITKEYIDIIYYESEESAVNDLENETIMGYLHVPDGFIKSVLRGKNMTATFVSNNSIIDMAPMIASCRT